MKVSLINIVILLFSLFAAGQTTGVQFPVSASDTAQAMEFIRKSRVALEKNTAEALLLAQKALSLSEKNKYTHGVALSLLAYGKALFKRSEFSSALTNLEKAKPLLQQLSDEYYLGQLMKAIGDVYVAKSNFRFASANYKDAMSLLRTTGQMKLFNECQDAMGNITMDFGRQQIAAGYFKKSLEVKNSLNDIPGMIAVHSKLSEIYRLQKEYDSALLYNKEARQLAKNDADAFAGTFINKLIIFSFQGKISEAASAKERAEVLVASQHDSHNKVRLLIATTCFYMAQENKAMTTKYFDSVAALISGSQNADAAVSGLQLLADMSSQHDDYKTAYRMIKSMDHYKDIFRTENIERISAEIKNIAEAGLKEKEIEYLNLANKLKDEQLSKEELQKIALLREYILKDSALSSQKLLMEALETESALRGGQLKKEKELSQSLGRENELKQKLLNDELRDKKKMWFVLAAMAVLGMIIYFQYNRQRKKNQIINRQSAELEVLNKEIHHRVKNNLQVISSMLDLQSQSLNDEGATAIIKEGIQRVQSMAFIHQNLYQGNAVNSVNMNEYIKTLSTHLFQTYNIQLEKIKLHTAIEDISLHTDTAIPLGMILNELISNSLKYAFKTKDYGDIWVAMKKTDNELLLQVKDNGIGLPKNFNPDSSTSFGYEIIKAFTQKMKARMNVEGTNGTDVQIIISKFKTIA